MEEFLRICGALLLGEIVVVVGVGCWYSIVRALDEVKNRRGARRCNGPV